MLHSRAKRRGAAGGRGPAGLAIIALVVFGLAAVPAAADDRYVTPGGTGLQCTQPIPCDLNTGINKAVSGDAVHVAGDLGAYSGLTAILVAGAGVSVIGEGRQVPRIVFGNIGDLTVPPGASVDRLDMTRTGGTSVLMTLGGTGSRLRLESAGGPVSVTGLLRDSFVRASGLEERAILAQTTNAKLRNVTAVADGPGSGAILAYGAYDPVEKKCSPETRVELRNVIARGAAFDLQTLEVGGGKCPTILDVAYSNYRSSAVSLSGANTALVDQGGNQTGVEPLLASDGIHQLAGSPTIDAGFATLENGVFDFDGEPRSQGAAPDIGADEFPPPPPPLDTTAPAGSKLSFKPRRFRPRRPRPASIATASAKKRRKRSRRTSRVSYRLSEDARARFSVRRRAIGRKKGKRCLIGKRARRLRKAKKCKKLVRVKGAFTHAGTQGANRFRFSGYVGGRRLRPGAYRMVGVPTDAAGNRGRRFGGSFVVARR